LPRYSNFMRRPIMAGNWKMYKTPSETVAFFEKFRPLVADSTHAEIVICPPFVNLPDAVEASKGTRIEIGGQNLHWVKEGALTGEISAGMLSATGCKWVIVAHSERREYFGETEETALRKIVAALDDGLTPIYCVGEKLHEHEAGKTPQVLGHQLRGCVDSLTPEQFRGIVIAYEPVWAIGTGRVATPEIASEAHSFIREQIRERFGVAAADACRILYGGSVKPDNVKGLMARDEIDGALVGGASLDPASFAAIVNFE
jgi:triosephosphate isomerase (TIM)